MSPCSSIMLYAHICTFPHRPLCLYAHICTFPYRPSAFVSPKKSSYTTLLASPQDEPEPPQSPPESQPEARPPQNDSTDGGFTWTHLKNDHAPSSSADEASEKGHSRSTSLDLNKMLLTQSGGDGKWGGGLGGVVRGVALYRVVFLSVFGGLPSAVPPKPPPVSCTLR